MLICRIIWDEDKKFYNFATWKCYKILSCSLPKHWANKLVYFFPRERSTQKCYTWVHWYLIRLGRNGPPGKTLQLIGPEHQGLGRQFYNFDIWYLYHKTLQIRNLRKLANYVATSELMSVSGLNKHAISLHNLSFFRTVQIHSGLW